MKSSHNKRLVRLIISAGFILAIIAIELFIPFIGKALSKVTPCTDLPTNSAPCYLKYDLIGVIILIGTLITLILLIILKSIKKKPKTDHEFYITESQKDKLSQIIDRVINHISDDSDMTYVYYETASIFRDKLQNIKSEIQNDNSEGLLNLSIEFAPTSSIQEHSMANGWSDEYLSISEEFDKIEELIKR